MLFSSKALIAESHFFCDHAPVILSNAFANKSLTLKLEGTMPQRDLEIESYTVSVYNYRRQISAGNVSQNRNRRLVLSSTVLTHGIMSTLTLNFVTNASTGNIGFVTTQNYFQHSIFAWLPIGEFEEIYDICRNEAPIFASYWAESEDPWNPLTTSRSSQIRWVRVGTGTEPIGEGPSDDSGAMDAFVVAVAPELVEAGK